jgi:hypothetical protein
MYFDDHDSLGKKGQRHQKERTWIEVISGLRVDSLSFEF